MAVFGPTGLGKTEVALALARRLRGEIVSADSMQVYEGLAILTNQPSAEQLALVPHHLVAVVTPDVEFSVAAYTGLVTDVLDDLSARGCAAIIEGGSGLYLRAALGGLDFGPPPNAARAELEAFVARDAQAAVARLERLDPTLGASVDVRNPRRLVRALEAALRNAGQDASGREAPSGAGAPVVSPDDRETAPGSLLWSTGARGARVVALEPDRERLRERVDARVDEMLARGLVDEVRTVRESFQLSRTVRQAIGVREVCAYLDGELTLEEARRRMQARTRAYVRRQLTWMRKLPDAARIRVSTRSAEAVADEIIRRSS